jgi:hypothetical protein
MSGALHNQVSGPGLKEARNRSMLSLGSIVLKGATRKSKKLLSVDPCSARFLPRVLAGLFATHVGL